MGRNDLARVNYEAALALAPRDPQLLLALAPTLETLGKNAEAAEARAEATRLTAVPPAVVVAAPAASTPAQPDVHAVARLASSITVELPPARPLARARVQNISSAPAAPAARPSSPRLERLSMGEVALVTTSKPVWRAELVSRTRLSTTVRWVPIQTAAARPNIRISMPRAAPDWPLARATCSWAAVGGGSKSARRSKSARQAW